MPDPTDRPDSPASSSSSETPPPLPPEGSAPADPTPAPGRPQGFPPADGSLDRALSIVTFLREHCAWDRSRTPPLLVPHLLEEAHEVAEAIHADDPDALRDELGDLLLNLAFQVVLAEEAGRFTRDEVADTLEAKMHRRHPHLFEGGDRVPWEALKAREAARRRETGQGSPPSVLDGIVTGLPPLLRAFRLQERAAGVGFDWDDPSGALAKVHEELAEVEAAAGSGSAEALTSEIGDLLFAVVNVARLSGVPVLSAMESANLKFSRRFRALEVRAKERGVPLPGATLEALDALWDEIKGEEGREAAADEGTDAGRGGAPGKP